MINSTLSAGLQPSYYEASVSRGKPYVALEVAQTADVCVVGGGLAGCFAALHLAERGYRVALLEAHRIGSGASGRSGGQVIPGFASEQNVLDRLIGPNDADRLWKISVEAIALVRSRIAKHSIECDWQDGQLQVGIKPRHRDALVAWHYELERRYTYQSTRLLEAPEIRSLLETDRYSAGLFDSNGAHLHPLKLNLGIAQAAASAGVQIYEESAAVEIVPGAPVRVRTTHGEIRATQVVLCGNAYLGELVPAIRRRIMPVGTYIVATEPLGESRVQELIRNNCGVTDTNFILDYFRRSADHRLLFGGRVSYSGRDTFATSDATRRRMVQVFPQLKNARIDFSWGGMLDITMTRAPDFGRIAPTVFYLQGFSGHGIALTSMAGQLVAEAIAGQAERFDLFGKIKHRDFPGGPMFRTPALVLAMLWYRLRDLL